MLMSGMTLKDINFTEEPKPKHVSVKEVRVGGEAGFRASGFRVHCLMFIHSWGFRVPPLPHPHSHTLQSTTSLAPPYPLASPVPPPHLDPAPFPRPRPALNPALLPLNPGPLPLNPAPPPRTPEPQVVLPFSKFPGADTLLGPEMRSTGEVSPA